MEAPPPSLAATPPIPAATPPAAVYPDSVDSSPRSRHTNSWDADAPPSQPPQKLRLMCSYGGHIIPRPHDKTLCYIGGDTRITVIERQTSLSDLRHRLSKTLLNNQSFTLKYQLPNEDLDSLISVTTDEDLENMVEEYDRLNNAAAGVKPGRLRLFLFPQTSSNIEQLLVETASTKSEDWFFNALNGKASTLSAGASDRGFSESSSVNCLLGLDDDIVRKAAAAVVVGKDGEPQIEGTKAGGTGNGGTNHDVHSVPDSPMLDTTSSFGSTNSSPSVANLPPIRVHSEENSKVGGLGIEDQFQQMTVNPNSAVTPKQEEVGAFAAAVMATAGTMVSGVPVVVGGGDYPNRPISDDERSDQGGYRMVPPIQPLQVQQQLQPQQIPQFYQKPAGAIDLASPDSVSSDGSLTNPLSRQRQAIYQEPIIQIQSANPRVNPNPSDLKSGDQNINKIQMQPQVQDSGYVLSSQYDQNHPQMHHPHQQFIHSGNQYIPAGAVPLPSYYSIYPSQQHQHQPVLDQQYPVYFVPARQTQPYNLQPNAPTSRPQTPPNAMAAHPAYNQAMNVASSKPEMAQGVYRTAAGGAPHMVQVPSSQHQGQYVGYSQVHHPSQMMAPPSSAPNQAYTYEYADPGQAQMYYTQAMPPQMAAQYQTLTSATAGVPSDASSQVSTDSMKQQVRT